jgi:hypothetical protein
MKDVGGKTDKATKRQQRHKKEKERVENKETLKIPIQHPTAKSTR